MEEKPVVWVGSADDDLRAFPEKARRRAGYELHQVQIGLSPSDWIYVLHAFEKKTVRTSKRDINVARSRFATVLADRGEAHG